MANYEATRYDFDGANLSGIEGIPTATIVPWSTASVPSGFLECNGQAVSRSTYATLFGIIGTTYGSGNGSTTFNVPDLQDNVAIGKSGTKNIGSTGGANTVANSGSVSTNTNTNINVTGNVGGSTGNATLSEAQLASHAHNLRDGHQPVTVYPGQGFSNSDNRPWQITNAHFNRNMALNNTGSGSAHSHNMSATFSGSGNAASASTSNFSGGANSVVQPYLTVMYIIKT